MNNMENICFVSASDCPLGYLMREISTGIVLERYFRDDDGELRDVLLEEYEGYSFRYDLEEVVRLARKLIKDSVINVEWDPTEDEGVHKEEDAELNFKSQAVSIDQLRESELSETEEYEEEDGLSL